MAYKVTQKGDFYFVEDTALSGKIIERFKDKEKAIAHAKKLSDDRKDYFKDTHSNIDIKSVDMNI